MSEQEKYSSEEHSEGEKTKIKEIAVANKDGAKFIIRYNQKILAVLSLEVRDGKNGNSIILYHDFDKGGKLGGYLKEFLNMKRKFSPFKRDEVIHEEKVYPFVIPDDYQESWNRNNESLKALESRMTELADFLKNNGFTEEETMKIVQDILFDIPPSEK